MSTRGLFGFRKSGVDKAVYSHSDSYPEWLGENFTKLLVRNADKLPDIYEKIITVDVNSKPTEEQKKICKDMGWYNRSVSCMNDDDWYCLLYGLQDIESFQKAVDEGVPVFIENYISFIRDSLFCEYAYIYDLDSESLEFYIGFQKVPDENNIYGQRENEGYFPCRLAHVFPLDVLKTEKTTHIVQKMIDAAQ